MQFKSRVTAWRSFLEAYENFCKPLCRELGMPQMAFDVLMFLSNNPEHFTAKEISCFHGFKENILSVNINKLVSEGYLERLPVDGDRRKIKLVCTEKAKSIIERGRKLQEEFDKEIHMGLTEQELEQCRHYLDIVNENAKRIKSQKR